ncbi:hypothetical protein [Escherichia coli]|uniref:hypothetical protein n=1 Tax=Escherichia coli TaxID=562 RepID=UPI0029C3176B|nr:hypothetical protein [Escherichia coli]MDX5693442.1 hypothetical protein [Escherichia coli]
MEVIYIAEPIISTNINKLIAVELLSRFYSKTGVPLSTQRVLSMFTTAMKINLLKSQIKEIINHRDFFEHHGVLCSVNIDYETCLYIRNIIAEGVENIYYNGLSMNTGLWGTQGYFFPSVPLSEIKHMNSAWL